MFWESKMPALPDKMFLLARQELLGELYRASRTTKTEAGWNNIIFGLAVFAGIVVAFLILSLVINRRQRRRGHSSPQRLFLSLCRAHKLKWRESWLLWRLARQQHLADPARLFLEPQWYEGGRLPPALRPRSAQLKALRERLFAETKKSGFTSKAEKIPVVDSIQSPDRSLPGSSAVPELDIPPWPTTTALPPSVP